MRLHTPPSQFLSFFLRLRRENPVRGKQPDSQTARHSLFLWNKKRETGIFPLIHFFFFARFPRVSLSIHGIFGLPTSPYFLSQAFNPTQTTFPGKTEVFRDRLPVIYFTPARHSVLNIIKFNLFLFFRRGFPNNIIFQKFITITATIIFKVFIIEYMPTIPALQIPITPAIFFTLTSCTISRRAISISGRSAK